MSLPPKLYRYRSIRSDEGFSRLKEILLENRIYLTSRKDFNDPFDCRLPVSWKGSFKAKKRTLVGVYKRKYPSMRRKEIIEVIKGQRDKGTLSELGRTPESGPAHDKAMDALGILCLSSRNDDILMWAHYADGHTGVCLEFDTTVAPFMEVKRVKYQNEYPNINMFSMDRRKLTEELVGTKAKHWEYEDEWRIINTRCGFVTLRPDSVTGLIFGCQVPENREKEIKQLAFSRRTPLTLYRAIKSSSSFSLNIEKLA